MKWRALGALNARWALPVYPVFQDEKSNGSDKNRSSEKSIKRKKTDRTNMIATNFVWEQLITDRQKRVCIKRSPKKAVFLSIENVSRSRKGSHSQIQSLRGSTQKIAPWALEPYLNQNTMEQIPRSTNIQSRWQENSRASLEGYNKIRNKQCSLKKGHHKFSKYTSNFLWTCLWQWR